jgi:hypothetical protein
MERQLIGLPESMTTLPLDDRGLPVPHYIEWVDGEPDYSRVKPGWHAHARKNNLCWLCNEFLGVSKWFVLDDIMRCVSRTAADLPSHCACAEFAAKNYPCMTEPLIKRKRQHEPVPRDDRPPVPRVCCLWETKDYRVFPNPSNTSLLIDLGAPNRATFWCEGRAATHEEVLESVAGGVPYLWAEALEQGPQALLELTRRVESFGRWLDKVLPSTVGN